MCTLLPLYIYLQKNSPWNLKIKTLHCLHPEKLMVGNFYIFHFFLKCHSISGSMFRSVIMITEVWCLEWCHLTVAQWNPNGQCLGIWCCQEFPRVRILRFFQKKTLKIASYEVQLEDPRYNILFLLVVFFVIFDRILFSDFLVIWSSWGALINEVVGWQTLETQQLENRIVESMKRWRFRQWQPEFDPGSVRSVDLKSLHSLSYPTSQSLTDTFPLFFGWVPIGEGVDSPTHVLQMLGLCVNFFYLTCGFPSPSTILRTSHFIAIFLQTGIHTIRVDKSLSS